MPEMVLQKPDQASWVRYMLQRVEKNRNFIGVFIGKPGIGKSWSALAACEAVDPNFGPDQIVFGARELINLINDKKVKRGSAILFEEAGIDADAHKWQSATNKALKYLFETFRHRNFVLLITVPYPDYVSKSLRMLIDAIFEMTGVNKEKKCGIAKPQFLQYNYKYSKMYYKYLRVITPNGVVPIKRWYIPKPSQDLLTEYEKKKSAFTTKLFARIDEELAEAEAGPQKKKYPAVCLRDTCGHRWISKRDSPAKCPKCGYKKTVLTSTLKNKTEQGSKPLEKPILGSNRPIVPSEGSLLI